MDRKASRLDLLFVIDNSISMADKQALLRQSIPALVDRLTTAGGDVPSPPSIHIGVISTSLGSNGADTCDPNSDGEDVDDRGELIGTRRRGMSIDTQGRGFLSWDPERQESPPRRDQRQRAELQPAAALWLRLAVAHRTLRQRADAGAARHHE